MAGLAAKLVFLAQIAILPGTNSQLGQIPFWQWALGHCIYGLVLGSMFLRRA
jgi:putative exporter of polyketide antibiotics